MNSLRNRLCEPNSIQIPNSPTPILSDDTLQFQVASLVKDCFTINNTNSNTTKSANLSIIHQNSLAQEKFSKDGVQKCVHIVVKNTPFQISVGLSSNMLNGRIIDFNLLTVDATLLFDTHEEKEVPYLKQKPVEYKGKVNDRADTMNLDLKIKVLTSHCENMLFRIKFVCMDPRSGDLYPTLTVVSAPIKVISKPDQLRKRKQPDPMSCEDNSSQTMDDEDDLTVIKPAAATSKKGRVSNPRPKKKARLTINDKILESLNRIEEKQRAHETLLESISDNKLNFTDTNHQVASTSQTTTMLTPLSLQSLCLDMDSFDTNTNNTNNSNNNNVNTVQNNNLDLENAYEKFIDIYMKLPQDGKAEEIRKIIRNSTTRKTETFCEMVALFNSEGIQKEMGRDCLVTTNPSGNCDADCPHKRELQKIDDFYNSMMNFTFGA